MSEVSGPQRNVDGMFIGYNANQKMHQTGAVRVDSTSYSKDIHTQDRIEREKRRAQNNTSQKAPAQPPKTTPTKTTPASKSTGKTSGAKPKTTPANSTPAKKAPAATSSKPEKVELSTGQKTVGEQEHGFFHTNLPVYESANITKPQPPYKTTKEGVEIYIKGDETDSPVTLSKTGNGETLVKFKNSDMYAIIPPQENPKDAMIVYNPETKTMVFNNLKGITVKTKIANSQKNAAQELANKTGGGDNLLFNNCTVKELNTAEIDEQGNYVKNYASQNIVLNNTKVSKFDVLNDLYITTGDTEIRNANNHPEHKNAHGHKTTTYHASDGKDKVSRAKGKTNGNGQDHFTLAQGVKWLNGGKDATNIDTDDTRGSININNEAIKIKFDNVPVCRSWNGVNFYIKGGDAKSIRNIGTYEYGEGQYFNLNGTIVKFPPQAEGKNANIYYDAETQTLVFENIDGLDVNYSSTQTEETLQKGLGTAKGAHKAANIYIRNCHCKHVNFMETQEAANDSNHNGVKLSENAETSRSTIMIDETSAVDELLTYKDDVYTHSGATVKKFAGIDTNTQGQSLDNVNGLYNKKTKEDYLSYYLKTDRTLPSIIKDNVGG